MDFAINAFEARVDDAAWSRRRLRLLVAAHLLVSAVLVAKFLIPAHVHYLPLMWMLASLSIAQGVLLSFWAAMGTQRAGLRLLGALLGSVYVAAWPAFGSVFAPHPAWAPERSLADTLLNEVGAYCAAVLFFSAIFGIARRWFVELRLIFAEAESSQPGKFQYSIQHILIVTSIASVVLALRRSATHEGPGGLTDWEIVAGNILITLTMAINAVCAACAALAVGPVRTRVCLVLLVALLLGAAVAFSGSGMTLNWWLSPSFALTLTLPTAIILASLLVVRSCGYRLVARTRATR